jgi:hypothetical protein
VKLSMFLVVACSCAAPAYVRAPVYAPPPSLPAAQARELAAEVSAVADDLENMADESCALLRSMDASVPPGECP